MLRVSALCWLVSLLLLSLAIGSVEARIKKRDVEMTSAVASSAWQSVDLASSSCTFNLTDPTSIAMISASGHGPGDMGDYQTCLSLPDTQFCRMNIVGGNILPNISSLCPAGQPASYCYIGACLPSACTVGDGVTLIEFEIFTLTGLTVKLNSTCGDHKVTISDGGWKTILSFVVCGIIVGLALLGTLLPSQLFPLLPWLSSIDGHKRDDDTVARNFRAIESHDSDVDYVVLNDSDGKVQGREGGLGMDGGGVDAEPATTEHTSLVPNERSSASSRWSNNYIYAAVEGLFFSKVLALFSIPFNIGKLLSPIPPALNMPILNGLRVISMWWVILGHTFVFVMTPGFDNAEYIITDVANRDSFNVVIENAPFAVDTFFFISGFLTAYFLVKELASRDNAALEVTTWIYYVFHRCWRLWPVYAFFLMFLINITPLMGSGPFWDLYVDQAQAGSSYWWSNLLFINNFYPRGNDLLAVAGWTWFIAVDMQLYVAAPLLIVPYHFNKMAGWLFLLAAIIGCLITNMAIVWHNDFQQWIFSPLTGEYFIDVYYKPWTRALPYLVGIAAAWIYQWLQNADLKPAQRFYARLTLKLYYLVGLALIAIVMLITVNDQKWNETENVIYLTTFRLAWGLGLAALTLGSLFGYGGAITTFLSWRAWEPLGKVTYGAYLAHPVFLTIYAGVQQDFLHYMDLNIAVIFLAVVVMAYTVGSVVYVLIEKPSASIEGFLLRKLRGIRGL